MSDTESIPIRWSSYDNIQKYLSRKGAFPDAILKMSCLATLKIDGSNLAVHMRQVDPTGWQIEALHGRNQPIWIREEDPTVAKLSGLKYGNAGFLGKLPEEMFRFVQTFAESISVRNIVVYGEVYRFPEQRFVSWHPFGYKLPDSDWQCHKLDLNLHAQFTAISGHPRFDNPCDCFQFLQKVETHVIFPPPVCFSGILRDGIETLFPLMMNPPMREFEGVFLVLDNGHAVKWKTGLHEEQKYLVSIDAIRFEEETSRMLYGKLKEVFDARPEMKIKDIRSHESMLADAARKESERCLQMEMERAIRHELTKWPDMETLSKKDRAPKLQILIPRAEEELKSRYEGTTIPWTDEQINYVAKSVVPRVVMTVPVVG